MLASSPGPPFFKGQRAWVRARLHYAMSCHSMQSSYKGYGSKHRCQNWNQTFGLVSDLIPLTAVHTTCLMCFVHSLAPPFSIALSMMHFRPFGYIFGHDFLVSSQPVQQQQHRTWMGDTSKEIPRYHFRCPKASMVTVADLEAAKSDPPLLFCVLPYANGCIGASKPKRVGHSHSGPSSARSPPLRGITSHVVQTKLLAPLLQV